MNSSIGVDVVILGGGIQGLWLLADLVDQDYQAILLERFHPGSGQTGHAHFFLHQGHMRAAMEARVPTDDSGEQETTRLRSRRIKLFQNAHAAWMKELESGRLQSVRRLQGKFYISGSEGAKRDRLQRILKEAEIDNFKEFRNSSIFRSCSWMLEDEGICLESSNVLDALLKHRDLNNRIGDCNEVKIENHPAGGFHLAVEKSDKRDFEIICRGLVFTAGAGNEHFILRTLPASGIHLDTSIARQQTIKTYMLVIKDMQGTDRKLERMCAMFPDHHNIFLAYREDPRDPNTLVWLLGDGQRSHIRTPGQWTGLNARSWFQRIRPNIKKLFPWLLEAPESYRWGIYEATKAEPWTPKEQYPDQIMLPEKHQIHRVPGHNAWVAWPSFLTLAPTVAAEMAEAIATSSIPRSTQIVNRADWDLIRKKVEPGKDLWETTPLLDWDTFSRCYA
jgi:glycine/D-amino acid oxidase-like deaminating enzyme